MRVRARVSLHVFWRGFWHGVDEFADGKSSVSCKFSVRLRSSSPEVSMKVPCPNCVFECKRDDDAKRL